MMNLGNSLFHARKKSGFSQEEVAEKIGVSRQTLSKWETNETIPDIYQAKKLGQIYHVSLGELIEFDMDINEIHEMIEKHNDKVSEKVNWTEAWGKKYPILIQYQSEVNIPNYAFRIATMLDELQEEYQYSQQDAMLVLKDILYHVWEERKKINKRKTRTYHTIYSGFFGLVYNIYRNSVSRDFSCFISFRSRSNSDGSKQFIIFW